MPLEFEAPKSTLGNIEIPPETGQILPEETEETIVDTVCDTADLESECRELIAVVAERRKSFLRMHAILSVFALALVAVIGVVGALTHKLQADAAYNACCVLLACLTVGFTIIAGVVRITRRNQKVRDLVKSLIAADSTITTGALIEALGIDDTGPAIEARRQLTRLAPRWAEEDFAVLTEDQRTRLRRIVDGVQSVRHSDASGAALGRRYHKDRTDLRIALCSALGRLGNKADLEALRRCCGTPGVALWERPLRDAAELAIQQLDARLAELKRPYTLLRASQAPAAGTMELVRAAGAPGATPHEQLLRPGPTQTDPEDSVRATTHG